jgi:hypothetical protein
MAVAPALALAVTALALGLTTPLGSGLAVHYRTESLLTHRFLPLTNLSITKIIATMMLRHSQPPKLIGSSSLSLFGWGCRGGPWRPTLGPSVPGCLGTAALSCPGAGLG